MKTKYLYILRLFLDFITITIALILTIVVCNLFTTYNFSFGLLKPIYFTSLALWYISSKVFYLYNDITLVSFSQEIVGLIKVSIFHLLLLVFILFAFNLQDIFREFVIFYATSIFSFVSIQKYIYRIFKAKNNSNDNNIKNTVIVGNKNISNFLNGSNLSNNNLNLNIIGILNDEDTGKNGYNLLGPINSLSSILQTYSIDQVLVCLSIEDDQKIEFVIAECERLKILISILTSPTNQLSIGTKRVINYANIPVLFFKNYPLDDKENVIFKRIFDIIFSSLVILFLISWLFPLVAFLIKLTSKGPIFFIQNRWGINNKRIKCYKFRTMYIGSNEIASDGSYKPTQKNDFRITSIGYFLRKSSIDELPQFINVLLGNMSVIGPRPHPIPLNIQSKDQINNYMLRHLVKPGISGWAQVNGSRGEVKEAMEMQRRINYDIWYIENWTFWLDIQIIFQTIINLIKGDEKAF